MQLRDPQPQVTLPLTAVLRFRTSTVPASVARCSRVQRRCMTGRDRGGCTQEGGTRPVHQGWYPASSPGLVPGQYTKVRTQYTKVGDPVHQGGPSIQEVHQGGPSIQEVHQVEDPRYTRLRTPGTPGYTWFSNSGCSKSHITLLLKQWPEPSGTVSETVSD